MEKEVPFTIFLEHGVALYGSHGKSLSHFSANLTIALLLVFLPPYFFS
jgi:hypothetical protein